MTDSGDSGLVVGFYRIAVKTALNLAHDNIASGAPIASNIDSCVERIWQLNARIGEALDKY